MGSKKKQRRKRKLAARKKKAAPDLVTDIKRRSRAELGPIPPGKFHSTEKGDRGYNRKKQEDPTCD